MADTFVQMRFDEQALRRLERQMAGIPGAMNRIIPPSLNRTASWTKTRIKREVAGQMGSKVKEAEAIVPIQRASRMKWNAQVLILNARVPVARFPAVQTGAGVAYQLPRRTGVLRHAFWATMPTGHRGIFRRRLPSQRRSRGRSATSSPNLPIREQFLYLHQVLDFAFLPEVTQAAGAQLTKEIASRVRWQLQRRIA